MLSRAVFRRATNLLFKGFSTQKPEPPRPPNPPPKNNAKLIGIGLLATLVPIYMFSKDKTSNATKLNPPKEEPITTKVEVFETKADLKDGEMRAFQIGPKEEDAVLIVKHNGKYYCLQNKCSHFGFSLAKGNLFGDKIVCPLHHASFSIESGRPDTGPIFDGLQTYKITESNGVLKIEVPKGYLNLNKTSPMAKKTHDGNPVVIIGSGPAGLSAVETLRQAGFEGSITVITKDKNLPYDRTALSKDWKVTPDSALIRKSDFYDKYGIDVKKEKGVSKIDYAGKKVVLDDGSAVPYQKLLIATGTETVIPKIPGADKVPQLALRNLGDLERIRAAVGSNPKNITIIGAGFIGVELASTFKAAYKEANVTVVDSQATPFARVFGPEVGKSIQALAQKNGVKFELNAKIKEIKSENQKAVSVELENKSVPADVVIFATGVRPVTNFVGNLEIDSENGGIRTNTYLKTSNDDVYAAGDVASFPYFQTGNNARIEHWNQSIYEGSIAALNILGKKIPIDNVPFFWTRSFNNSLQFTGVTQGYDKIHVTGDLASQKFVVYYLKGDKVVGAAVMGILNSVMIINEALRLGVMPSADVIKKPDFKLDSLIPLINSKKPTCTKCQCMA